MKKNQIAKSEIKNAELKSFNLDKFASQLEKSSPIEKIAKDNLYIYPDGWNKEKINSSEGKSWRGNKRRKIESFRNMIILHAKKNQIEELKSQIESFLKFYKEFYSNNDFSHASISHSGKDKDMNELFLSICKESI